MKLAYSLEFDPKAGDFDDPLQSYSQLGTADPATIAFTLINTALIFLGTITLILIIVAGFIWLTAAGEEEKLKKAKDITKGATIGLIIVLGSYGLAQYLFTAIRIATQ